MIEFVAQIIGIIIALAFFKSSFSIKNESILSKHLRGNVIYVPTSIIMPTVGNKKKNISSVNVKSFSSRAIILLLTVVLAFTSFAHFTGEHWTQNPNWFSCLGPY